MIDVLAVRKELNELPFQNGRRQVYLGRISDHLDAEAADLEADEEEGATARQDSSEVLDYLRRVTAELSEHGLALARSEEDPDVLLAVQLLRQSSEIDLSWMADAMNWVSRITTVAVMMIGPGILGIWLDRVLGTFFIGMIGFLVGVPLALWYLILLTRQPPQDDET